MTIVFTNDIIGSMDKERMLSLYRRLPRLIPRTPGEKMVAAGLGIDIGVGISMITLRYLQREGITNLTLETAGTIRDVLLWGGHIALSDYMLKLGGVFCMVYLEDENWLKRKVSQPETNKTPRTGRLSILKKCNYSLRDYQMELSLILIIKIY